MKNNTINICLLSHFFKDDNLGCMALAISNVKLLNSVLEELNLKPHYVIAKTKNNEEIDPTIFLGTNDYEYRTYPTGRETMKNPIKTFKTKVFKDCDCIFNICGGDGYTDIYGIKRLFAESQMEWVAKKNKVPVIFSPQTIGPFNSFLGKTIAKRTLSKVNYLFVRDKESYAVCEKLKLKTNRCQVIDVAFALPYEKDDIENDNKFNIGVNVSGLLFNGGYNHNNYFGLSFDYSSFIRNLLEKLCSNPNYRVHLIPHVISDVNSMEDDYRVSEMLSKEFKCILAPKFFSPIEAKNYICKMDLFTGSRMHSTIAAISSGVPVIPISYSRKFNGLFSTLNYPWIIDAKSNISSEDALEQFFNYFDHIEELKNGLLKSKEVYIEELEHYKVELKKIISSL